MFCVSIIASVTLVYTFAQSYQTMLKVSILMKENYNSIKLSLRNEGSIKCILKEKKK